MVPTFNRNESLIITTNKSVILDTLLHTSEEYQELLDWLYVNDKWKRGKQNSNTDLIFTQNEFSLRFSKDGRYVSVQGLFDKISHGNESVVSYYQSIEEGELDFLLINNTLSKINNNE
jgi:hypothetical protein